MSQRYRSIKFGRERDQRRALLKNLAEALILNESITTTLPRAKAVVSYTERLITKAKKNTLSSRRQLMSSLSTKAAAHKLVDELAPKLANRQSGYLRLQRSSQRRGDDATLVKVSFVDNLKVAVIEKPASKNVASPKKSAKEHPRSEEK